MFRHVVVWIDQVEAKIYHIEPDGFEVGKVKAPQQHLTRKNEEQGHHSGHEQFFQEVAALLKNAEEILVVGPSSAKLDFLRYVHKHDSLLASRILGMETLDHPTDGQLVAYVRHYFLGKDRMLGDHP